MRHEIEQVLKLSRTIPPDELILFLSQLEVVRLEAFMRLCAPASQDPPDRLLKVDEAATRLSMTKDYLYRHHAELPFTVRMKDSNAIRFSSNGIDAYLRKSR